ncbi:MAG: hypothetical protein SFV22_03060 [Saprospiraceae bacterium]|nr:hypothetical protein [Saprospiraceae bacterium]
MSRTRPFFTSDTVAALGCAVLLLFITSFLPVYFKTWFVEAGGNIKIAPFFGFLFAAGLLFRQNWAYKGSLVLGVALLLLFIGGALADSTKPGFLLALVLDAGLLFLLLSPTVKRYFSTGQ